MVTLTKPKQTPNKAHAKFLQNLFKVFFKPIQTAKKERVLTRRLRLFVDKN